MKPVAIIHRGWLALARRFRGLQRVIDLRERGVGIALVDEVVEVSSISQTVMRSRLSGRYSAFFAVTKSSVWFWWFLR
jgi:hypothetical protein